MIVHIHNSKYNLACVVSTIVCTTVSLVNAQLGNSKVSDAECRMYCHEDCSKFQSYYIEFRACTLANIDCDCRLGFAGLPIFLIPIIIIIGLGILITIPVIVYYIYSKKRRSGQYRERPTISGPITPSPTAIYKSQSNGVTPSSPHLATGIYSSPITASYNAGPVQDSVTTLGFNEVNTKAFFAFATVNPNDAPPSYDAVFEKH